MTTLTVSADALIAAIKRVFPHASTDQTLPSLAAMRFTTKGKYLIVSACDRYTIGETRLELSESDYAEPVDFLVNAKQLKALLPALKTTPYATIEPVEDTGGNGATFNGSMVHGYATEHYPATDRLWPDTFEPVSGGNFGMSAANIKKLTALPQGRHEKSTPLVFGQGADSNPNKPFVILFGEHTRVLVMPVRVGSFGDDSTYSSWSESPAVEAPASEDSAAA